MREHHIDAVWPAGESVLVNVDGSPEAQRVVRRAWRLATRLGAELTAVFVETPGWANAGPEERRAVEENLRFAEDLGAEVLRIKGQDAASALLRAARGQERRQHRDWRSAAARHLRGAATFDRLDSSRRPGRLTFTS